MIWEVHFGWDTGNRFVKPLRLTDPEYAITIDFYDSHGRERRGYGFVIQFPESSMRECLPYAREIQNQLEYLLLLPMTGRPSERGELISGPTWVRTVYDGGADPRPPLFPLPPDI